MARIRTLKPELWGSPTVAKLSRDARLLFIGLISRADDEGRMLGAPKSVSGEVFPNDEDVTGALITSWLDELEAVGAIERYTVEGVRYIQITKWTYHQKISKPTPSRLPRNPQGNPGESAEAQETPGESRGIPRTLDHGPTTVDPLALDERDEVREAVESVCGISRESTTHRAAQQLDLAQRELAAVGATPSEVRERANVYRTRWPDAALTPMALVKHWPSLNGAPAPALEGQIRPGSLDCLDCFGAGVVFDEERNEARPCLHCARRH